MTTRREGPKPGPADDATDVGQDDVGTDPMHPHPQDRPAGQEANGPASSDDDGRTDDESQVDPYRDSPGAAATRPMDASGPVPEPNEPA